MTIKRDNPLKLFRELLNQTGFKLYYLVFPIGLGVMTSCFEGLHISLLIPLIEGVVSLGYQEISEKNMMISSMGMIFPDLFQSDKKIFVVLVFGVFVSAVLKNTLEYCSVLSGAYLIRMYIHRLRCFIFNCYMSFGKLFFDRNSSGSLHQILVEFVPSIAIQLYEFQNVILTVFLFVTYMAILFWISWPLTLLCLCAFPISLLIMKWIILKIKISSLDYARVQEDIGKKIFNTLSCIPLVKAYSKEEDEKRQFENISHRLFEIDFSLDKKRRIIAPIQEILMLTAILFLVSFIARIVVNGGGHAAVAKYMVFFYVLRRVTYILRNWSHARGVIASLLGQLKRILEIYNDNTEYILTDGPDRLGSFRRGIEFRQLSFQYTPQKKVLHDLSLTFDKGKSHALVGPSGSGKTTIVSLILRFYDCPVGTLHVDGKDIRQYSMKSLRENIAFVSQDVYLFNDTIRNNITYGMNRRISDEEIWDVLKRSSLDVFVKSLHLGPDTMIGDRGVQLSGGEKQRLSIARAMLKNADILILDEATSSLDTRTEQEIQQAMDVLMKNKTAIIIAHRLSTIKRVDTIFFIEHGKLAESGNFEDILKRKERFYEFWQQQKIA